MIDQCTQFLRIAMYLGICGFLPGCSGGASVSAATDSYGASTGSLVGRILDTRTGQFVSREELIGRAARARLLILGEAHDNAVHHRLQAEILEAILRRGRAPALAMEQFDFEHQYSLDAARAKGVQSAEQIADAGRFDRKGWHWQEYKPLVEIAVSNRLPILAANLSRANARAIMKSGRPADGLAAAGPEFQAGLERDIVSGHCGFRPPSQVLSGMVEAQRARDALMAQTLASAGPRGAVLIAGAGHARRDRGAPAYLSPAQREELLSIGFIEVDPEANAPSGSHEGLFDLVWYTPRTVREDPCMQFRMP